MTKRPESKSSEKDIRRARLTVKGRVQGVGFRPHVYRLAHDLALTGLVKNTSAGVVVEVQGPGADVDAFVLDLKGKLPPLARITELDRAEMDAIPGEDRFVIVKSEASRGHQVLISPDVCICPDCLADMSDQSNRRYLYPFTNCTNCGPRYTITRSIPYDRPQTSMACFPMCKACQEEYDDPLNRRFHAQPNACPDCGPQVWLTDRRSQRLASRTEALRETALALAKGRIAAVKGLGGFHLACDAANQAAVEDLRKRKNRWGKPLAVMVPDIKTAREIAEISDAEQDILTGNRRPIVLARKKKDAGLAAGLSPDNDFIGLMLPYTPLHFVLLKFYREALQGLRPPVLVMTSGNLSEEPIALGNREALERLENIADVFLLHDRDILIRCDDSVLTVNPDTHDPVFIRRARGYTPSPVFLSGTGPSVLGVGPLLKNTVCLTKQNQAFVSQHIGDLENLETYNFFLEMIEHLKNILQVKPELVVADLHPDYMSTGYALGQDGLPVARLQHHFAHVYSVLGESGHDGPALGLALDGAGLGEDGTIWGGEGLFVNTETMDQARLARFARVLLPGGDAAVKEPWRVAQSYLWKLGITEPKTRAWPWLKDHEQGVRLVARMLEKKINCPATSSCGRLFDAVSALLGLKLSVSYEGQAAVVLEAVQDFGEQAPYPCPVVEDDILVLDTLELFARVYQDWEAGVSAPVISRRFHLGLTAGLADLAERMAEAAGVRTVGLSGGVMQNMTLVRELPKVLSERGFTPILHKKVPPNDACISLGQAFYGQRKLLTSG